MVKGQPGDDHIVRREMDGLAVARQLAEHGLMGKRHALLQAGGSGGMLQEDGVPGQAFPAAHRGEIRLRDRGRLRG